MEKFLDEPYCREHFLDVLDAFQITLLGRRHITIHRIIRHLKKQKLVIFRASSLVRELQISPTTLNTYLAQLSNIGMVERVDKNGLWRLLV